MIVDVASLSEMLGREVAELHVAIAKHECQGIRLGDIAEIFAAAEEEIQKEVDTPEYQQVKRATAMLLAKVSADVDISWDSLEMQSLQKLAKATQILHDPEFHLKVAAVANKAQRRHRRSADALNPVMAGARVHLTLSQRIVDKLNGGGTRVQERRIDIAKAAEHRLDANEIHQFLAPAVSEESAAAALDALDAVA